MNSLKGFRKLRSTAKKAKGGADPISFGARRTDCKISRGILLNLTLPWIEGHSGRHR